MTFSMSFRKVKSEKFFFCPMTPVAWSVKCTSEGKILGSDPNLTFCVLIILLTKFHVCALKWSEKNIPHYCKNLISWKFCITNYRAKYSCPIRLLDSMIINTSERNACISLIFWMETLRKGSIWDYKFRLGLYRHPSHTQTGKLRLATSAPGV